MNGRIRRAGLADAGSESGQSDDISKLRRISRRRCAICEISRRATLLDCVCNPVVHSPVTSLFRRSFIPSSPLTRSRVLAACLSPSFFDVILPCYYLDHRSYLAVREVAEKRDRDERRSRKKVSQTHNANILLLYQSRY